MQNNIVSYNCASPPTTLGPGPMPRTIGHPFATRRSCANPTYSGNNERNARSQRPNLAGSSKTYAMWRRFSGKAIDHDLVADEFAR